MKQLTTHVYILNQDNDPTKTEIILITYITFGWYVLEVGTEECNKFRCETDEMNRSLIGYTYSGTL